MPPKRKNPPTIGQSEPAKSSKKVQSLQDISSSFGDLKTTEFEPFQPEKERPAQALLPTDFPTEPAPADYFNLFFTSDLFDLIVRNTNNYASIQQLDKSEKTRQWHELNAAELRMFIGVIIYMGLHIAPETTLYWNSDLTKGPIHPITSHISLIRFQQIKRYLHISCVETDESKGFNELNNNIWWYKLEPLASRIQASFRQYYSPSTSISIDELMLRYFGRFNHTYTMAYKVYGIADHGYIYNILFAQVIDSTLCLTWQDNNNVLALSAIHTIHTADDFIARQRKRPTKTLTRAQIVLPIFRRESIEELEIPIFIDDYTYSIGGVDIANQLRESFETHRSTQRDWWPLFYWLIDVIVINSYRLYQVHMQQLGRKSVLSRVKFRISLYCYLFKFSESAKIHQL